MSNEPKRRGRPPFPAGTARTKQMMIRVSDADLALLEAAARVAGQPVSTWAHGLLVAAAQMMLEDAPA